MEDYKIESFNFFLEIHELEGIMQFNYHGLRTICFHNVIFNPSEAKYKRETNALVAVWHIRPRVIVTPTHMINFDINDPYDTDTRYKYE